MEEKQRASNNPMEILRGQRYNSENLHRIAISNLSDAEKRIERWWESKYKVPIKKYEDHTYEELMIKMLEDYYYKNPEEIQRFLSNEVTDDWDGEVSQEYEREVQKGLKKFFEKNKVDLSEYQDENFEDSDLSDEDILNDLRKAFPSRPIPKSLSEGEFDEDFEV